MPHFNSAGVLLVVAAALTIVVVRKGMMRLAPSAGFDGAAVAFAGSAPDDDERRGRSLFWLLSACLVVLITATGVLYGAVAVHTLAALFGFVPQTALFDLPNGGVLMAAYVVVFLWVQFGHFVHLRSVWTRGRFACLLVALPVAMMVLARLALGTALRGRLMEPPAAAVMENLSTLIAMGLLPFFVPALHGRALAPAAARIRDALGARWQEAGTYLGNTLVLLATLAAVLSPAFVPLSAIPGPSWPHKAGAPVPSGPPHVCTSDYPIAAMRAGEQGTAIMSFVITKSGTIKNVALVRSSGYALLDLAAVTCVTHWSYRPATVHGRPVETPWKAEVIFRLQ